ncbi:MAG: hypothetical protein GX291_00960 [Tissierellia bacterium]|jgi:uncharacterized Zn ribbon protein|nr:hypothetical protein [Bacillota bacterium]NLK57822.1 hypothetical protein [Tissierellia bacterium]
MSKLLLFFAVLFTVRILRNVLAVIREKIALSNNMIVIESDHISNEDLKRAEVKMFMIQGKKIHAGDQIKVITKFKDKIEGMVLGIDTKQEALILADEASVMDIQFGKIADVKLISRYGKFFTF